jgi:hypothetical protein
VSKEDTDTSDSESVAGKSLEVQESLGLPIRVPQYLRTFVLPSGFPGTRHVTDFVKPCLTLLQ